MRIYVTNIFLAVHFVTIGAQFYTSSTVMRLFGQGSGPIAFNYIRCAGTESMLSECPTLDSTSCAHSEDIGIGCLQKTGNNFDI